MHSSVRIGHSIWPDAFRHGTNVLVESWGEGSYTHKGPIMPPSLNICENSSAPAVMERARAWLRECVSEHPDCRIPSLVSAFAPTRLLDVQIMNKAGKVLLVEPLQPVEYACLSYCWGPATGNNTSMFKHNLRSRMREGVACQLLPKTVRDALAVCREVEIRYPWVDALSRTIVPTGNKRQSSRWRYMAGRIWPSMQTRRRPLRRGFSAHNSTEINNGNGD